MGTGVEWEEVAGVDAKEVHFTVYKADGVTVEDISGHTVTLKVWSDEGAANEFTGNCPLVGGGNTGRCKYVITATDMPIGTEGHYFFTLKLDDATIIRYTARGDLSVLQGPPV